MQYAEPHIAHGMTKRTSRRAGSCALWSAGSALRIAAVCALRRFMRVMGRGLRAVSCAKRRDWERRYSLPFTSAAPIWNAFFISSGKTVSWRFFFASASKYQGQSVLL